MNLFRPCRAEPERDETGRLVGIDRYQEVLGLGWKRFFLSGLLTMAGCLPLTLGVEEQIARRYPDQTPRYD